MKRIAVVLASLMVVACNTPQKKDAPMASQVDTTKGAVATASVDQSLSKQSIYFDLDKAVVTSEYKASIQNEAVQIKSHKNSVVTLEGNCDERGSAEYNLSLGKRRADAVKKLLVAAGVHAKQIKTTSLGSEKPKLTCHDESCWKENRRVDFIDG